MRLSRFVIVLCLVSLLGARFAIQTPEAQALNEVKARIPFEPNPKKWFARPQSQKEWEKEQAEKQSAEQQERTSEQSEKEAKLAKKQAERQAKAELKATQEREKQARANAKAARSGKKPQQAKRFFREPKPESEPLSNKKLSTASQASSAAVNAPETYATESPLLPGEPDKDYIKNNCEPIRLKVFALNKKNLTSKPFTMAERRRLMRAHEACVYKFTQDEIRYIRNFQFAKKNQGSPTTVLPDNLPEDAVVRIKTPGNSSSQPTTTPVAE